jgi:hypothetical protein
MAQNPPDPTACPECGHRSVKHVDGTEPCNLPGCPCARGKQTTP